MWWAYVLVFIFTMIVDCTPLPLPPAFTVMILMQNVFHLQIWPVIILGVIGSAIGRYLFSLYIGRFSAAVLKPEKVDDIHFLGEQLNATLLRAQVFTFIYTLLPISSTPLFVTAGIAQIHPMRLLPAFIAGKFISDAAAVFMGNYVVENAHELFSLDTSPRSLIALVVYILILLALLFVDWRSSLMEKKVRINARILKKRKKGSER